MAQLGIGSPSPGNRPRNNNSGLDDNSGLADLLDAWDANDLPSTPTAHNDNITTENDNKQQHE